VLVGALCRDAVGDRRAEDALARIDARVVGLRVSFAVFMNGWRLATGTTTSTFPNDDDAGSHARRASAQDKVQRRSSGEHRHRVEMQRGRRLVLRLAAPPPGSRTHWQRAVAAAHSQQRGRGRVEWSSGDRVSGTVG
jgi:hypothetical protein